MPIKLKEIDDSYNRALHIFVMCLGALLGPFFIASGFEPKYRTNLIAGLVLLGYRVFWFLKIYPDRHTIPKSDKMAFLVAPAILLPFGVLFALLGNEI